MGITDFTLSSFDSSLVNRYILFLPELDTDGYQKGEDISLYYCIDSDGMNLMKILYLGIQRVQVVYTINHIKVKYLFFVLYNNMGCF